MTKSFTQLQIFSLLRILCGLHFILYALFVLLPDFDVFFSANGMVKPELFNYYIKSPLFYVWKNEIIKHVLFIFMLFFSITFTIGYWARYSQFVFFSIYLFFHKANPFIIHEPQQIGNLLLIALFLCPIEGAYILKRSPYTTCFENISVKQQSQLLLLLQIYLGSYYFFAGLKKTIDTNWLTGDALKLILNWPYLAKQNFLTSLFKYDYISSIATWGTLLFELSFVMVSFTKYKRYLINLGVLFHTLIIFTLDVGYFWTAMIIWYPILLTKPHSKI